MALGTKFHLSITLLLFALMATGYAQNADTSTKQPPKIKVLPVPAFGHSPETSTYIGAVCLFTLDFYRDTLTRTSNAKLEFNYTWRKQMIFEAGWNYFFREEKWYTQGTLQYSKFPDYYYGIGESTGDAAQVLYQSNRMVADVNFLKNISKKFFIGPRLRYINYYALSYDTAMNYHAELVDANIAGGGFTALKDTRNNLLNPGSGTYLELTNTYNGSAGIPVYSKLLADARGYKTIRPNVIIAGRFLNEFTFGNPPFYDYSLLGGDKKVRGIYYGRFRDKNLATLQAEVRFKLVWRFGAAVFGGASKVYPEFNKLSFNNIKPNYGAGIRFLIDRKQNINLRFDYAMAGDGQDGFYVSFGESF
jgi:outer membrane protein assembly factor BamA